VRKAEVIVVDRHAATLAVLGNNSATTTVHPGCRVDSGLRAVADRWQGSLVRASLVDRLGDHTLPCPIFTLVRRRLYSVGMSGKGRILLGLLLFNGISAGGGGIALMTGAIPRQASWLQHTDFVSQYVPGVILMAVVGGSSLVAALAMMKGADGWQLSSILAGVIMLFWIIGEIASIRAFHFLQVIYFVTGAAVIWFTPKGKFATE